MRFGLAEELQVSYSRSSGPGGQNVNKGMCCLNSRKDVMITALVRHCEGSLSLTSCAVMWGLVLLYGRSYRETVMVSG